jgi:Ulp1 family protease
LCLEDFRSSQQDIASGATNDATERIPNESIQCPKQRQGEDNSEDDVSTSPSPYSLVEGTSKKRIYREPQYSPSKRQRRDDMATVGETNDAAGQDDANTLAQGTVRKGEYDFVGSPPRDQSLLKRRQLGKPVEAINSRDLNTLEPGEWVNDEIMNTYLDMMIEALPGIATRVYVFNSFFYKNLNKDLKKGQIINYKIIERWTKDIDILQYDYIIVPINIPGFHWFVAIICKGDDNK